MSENESDTEIVESEQVDQDQGPPEDGPDPRLSVSHKLGSAKKAFIPLSKAYRFAALYLTPEQIKQAAMWKKPSGWPDFVPWTAPIVKACQMWLNPNIGAAMEIADRTEGKVKQMLEVENRGVVALPVVQISSAEEWRKTFAPKQGPPALPPVTVELIEPPKVRRGRGRPRKERPTLD
jgi:hypothetical protein